MFSQIKINDLNKSIFDQISTKEIKILKNATTSFVVNTKIFEKLLQIEKYPINKRLAIINIIEFLEYLDIRKVDSYNAKIEMPKKVFTKYFSHQHYPAYQDILAQLGIITVTTHPDGTFYTTNYKEKTPVGVKQKPAKCKIFKVGFNYLNNNELSLVVPEHTKREIKVDNQIKTLDKRFINTIKKVEINIMAAIEGEIEEYRRSKINFNQLTNRLHRLFQLKRVRKIKYGKKVNRIYHSLTNLSKVSRKHLSIPFFYADVKNCQPLLLCALMVKDGYIFDKKYQKDCEIGLVYENFGIEKEEREKNKVLLYSHVYFGFKPSQPINIKFKELFPLTWEYLKNTDKEKKEIYKRTGKKVTLASKLQNLESELFNNLIPVKSKHFFTLFDAIYFDREEDLDEILLKIKQFFGELGLGVLVKDGKNSDDE